MQEIVSERQKKTTEQYLLLLSLPTKLRMEINENNVRENMLLYRYMCRRRPGKYNLIREYNLHKGEKLIFILVPRKQICSSAHVPD